MSLENNDIKVDDLKQLKEKLSSLKSLLDEGLITKEEFEEKRNVIMGKKPTETLANKAPETINTKPKVLKCPSCGEILNTFDTKCPTCGYEISDIEQTHAMRSFQEGLSKIQEQKKSGAGIKIFGFDVLSASTGSNIDERKCEYIRNYIVPRTKENFIEFGILAKSNVEPQLYHKNFSNRYCGCENEDEYKKRKNLSDAWWSMLRQIFDKTKIIFADDETTYKKIEQLYVEVYNKIM